MKTSTALCFLLAATFTVSAKDDPPALEQRLKEHIIPNLSFQKADLADVLEYFHAAAGEPGVNFVLIPAAAHQNSPKVTMQVSNIPLYEAIRYVCMTADAIFKVEENAVVVRVHGAAEKPGAYHVDVNVHPADGPGQYQVEFKITEKNDDGSEDLLSAPKVIVLAGQEGQIQVGQETADGAFEGLACTALIKEMDGAIESKTRVSLTEGGKEVLSYSQTTTMGK